MTSHSRDRIDFIATSLAGAAATAAGNGLARFAYVPLFPAMVAGGWVNGVEAATLGSLTLLGALLGTLSARAFARLASVPAILDIGMVLVAASLLCCALNWGFYWFALWRSVAGIGGGILMALAGPAVVASSPIDRRGLAGGIVVAGVGSGIAAGALAVPALLAIAGLPGNWLGLAGLVILLWLAARRYWPSPIITPVASRMRSRPGAMLTVVYALHSAGMVPPMVYLSDLAVRGHHLDIGIGSLLWFAFGIAGVGGGMLSGRLADWLGSRIVIKLFLAAQVIALALCTQPATVLIVPAAAIAGFAAVGTTTVTLAVAQEIAGQQTAQLWVRCTAAFSITQSVIAFVMAGLFAVSGESHLAVFTSGLVFSLFALAAAWRL